MTYLICTMEFWYIAHYFVDHYWFLTRKLSIFCRFNPTESEYLNMNWSIKSSMKSRNISSHSGTYLGQLYPERLCFSECPTMFYMWYSYFLSGTKARNLAEMSTIHVNVYNFCTFGTKWFLFYMKIKLRTFEKSMLKQNDISHLYHWVLVYLPWAQSFNEIQDCSLDNINDKLWYLGLVGKRW